VPASIKNNATTYTIVSNDKVTVAVPAAALFAGSLS
jgi:hypothetical protein